MTLFTAKKNRQADKDGKQTPPVPKKKLSRADRKQIEAAIARANRSDKKEKSAQDSIPYERMWPDGICRLPDGHYTKTIQFQDINYQLSQNEDKMAIFEGWCDFLNYFDSSIRFQLSFLNLAASEETFARAISIPLQGDDFDSIRTEYMTMLQNQLAKGNNGLIKTKYLTFGIDADSLKAAKPRLERIETDILNNFKRLGVVAESLGGKARLAQLHGIFHMDEQVPFRFEWDWLAPSGLSTKDFVAPSGFEFRTGKQFRMGKKYGAVSFVQILAPELNDRMLADFLDMESSLIVSLHIQSVDQVKAIRKTERENQQLKEQLAEQENRQRMEQNIAKWSQEAQAIAQKYPGLDLEKELGNPQFFSALMNGASVEGAYWGLYHDQLIPQAMQYTAQETERKLAAKIQAQGQRPTENGAGAGVSMKNDVSQLSDKEMDDLIRRARRGEKICF